MPPNVGGAGSMQWEIEQQFAFITLEIELSCYNGTH